MNWMCDRLCLILRALSIITLCFHTVFLRLHSKRFLRYFLLEIVSYRSRFVVFHAALFRDGRAQVIGLEAAFVFRKQLS